MQRGQELSLNEHGFTRAVLAKLPPWIHTQSMTSASLNNNGTPDRYIDGPAGDLWVEFKYLKRKPRVLQPDELLSALQLRWLTRRGGFGNAVVVIGFELGPRTSAGLVLDQIDDWTTMLPRTEYEARLQTIDEVSNYITRRVSNVQLHDCPSCHRQYSAGAL